MKTGEGRDRTPRLARRRSLAQENGAAVCAALCQFDAARRYELGVEAMCQLSIDVVVRRAQNRDAAAPQDAWGNDARAEYAQARFATLTGIVRGPNEKHDAYMHAALSKALSDVQA